MDVNVKSNYLEGFEDILNDLGKIIKSMVKKSVEDEIRFQMEQQNKLNSTITREDLCKRWGCCKNTIMNKEKEGLLYPLRVNGKKKVYSMNDIINLEMGGNLKYTFRNVG